MAEEVGERFRDVCVFWIVQRGEQHEKQIHAGPRALTIIAGACPRDVRDQVAKYVAAAKQGAARADPQRELQQPLDDLADGPDSRRMLVAGLCGLALFFVA